MLDVCLILEGTYPYTPGGVAAWVNGLVRDLSSLRFGIVYLGPGGDVARKMHYTLHNNVESYVEIFVHRSIDEQERTGASPAPWLSKLGWRGARRQRAFAILRRFYHAMASGDRATTYSLLDEVVDILSGQGPHGLSMSDLMGSVPMWDLLTELYETLAPTASFLDFFWTARYTHLPVLQCLRSTIPEAAVYHAVSTGYAGVLGAVAARRAGAPFILTEHGIYTKERKIEIQGADWIRQPLETRARAERSLGVFKDWWIAVFEQMASLAYHQAAEIITIYKGNRTMQELAGAPAERCVVIPNGVDLASFDGLRTQTPPARTKQTPFVALVGRVVPVKDVKTFLRTARLILENLGEAVIQVIGPTDEDEAYYRDCLLQLHMLGLETEVQFTGIQPMTEVLKELDCLVLTSISEGQPLVILEAMAAGVPVVATDVGACRELIEGATNQDRALGASGIVCPVANPEALATAVQTCVRDLPARSRMIAAGLERVRRFYQRRDIHGIYLDLYAEYRNRYVRGERFVDPSPAWGTFARELAAGWHECYSIQNASTPWPALALD